MQTEIDFFTYFITLLTVVLIWHPQLLWHHIAGILILPLSTDRRCCSSGDPVTFFLNEKLVSSWIFEITSTPTDHEKNIPIYLTIYSKYFSLFLKEWVWKKTEIVKSALLNNTHKTVEACCHKITWLVEPQIMNCFATSFNNILLEHNISF